MAKLAARGCQEAAAQKMGKSCCAVGCTNRYTKGGGLQFYRFPTDSDQRARWIAAVDRKNWEPNQYTWICSAHFVRGVKSNDPASPAYVPSLFSYVKSPVKRKAENDMQRYNRTKACKKRRLEASLREEAAEGLMILSDTPNSAAMGTAIEETPCIYTSKSTMTEMSVGDIDKLQSDNFALREENKRLKEVITRQALDEQSFEGNDKKVKYYTGLTSFATLMAMFNFISPFISKSQFGLPLFQQYLVVLIKLRLNIANQYLGYQFGVHHSTISRYFRKWITVMYER